MFQLTTDEWTALRSHFGTLDMKRQIGASSGPAGSQTMTLKPGRGQHRKYRPYVFTEQGVAMLSSVLRSDRAIAVNVEIMRAFVRLRQILASHADLARRLDDLEKKYDAKFRAVFDAIRQLMAPPPAGPRRPIGFQAAQKKD